MARSRTPKQQSEASSQRAGGRAGRRSAAAAVLVAACVLLPTACSLYRPKEHVDPPVHAPERFNEPGGEVPLPDRWWEDFGDDELAALIDSAIAGNMELGAAWARLDQALADARKSRAGLIPEVMLEADASRSESAFQAGETFQRVTGEAVQRVSSDQLLLTAAASYEVDLWRRIWALTRAGELEFGARREDVATMAMSIAGEMANAWVTLIEQRAQRELLASQAGVGERFLRLTELRFSQGLASALDVYQQRQQLASTRARIPLVEAGVQQVEHQIAVLRGTAPGGDRVTERTDLPELPPLPSTGLPADLLQRRPDVRSAALRVAAADHRVAAAVAERLPALRLTARGSYQSFAPAEDLFDTSVWNIAGNLAAPFIDGGRRRAEVDRTKAVVDEQLHAYGQAFLKAVQEVEDALVQERRQHEHLAELDRQVTFSERALVEARLRYVTGLSDYLPVLAALQTLQDAERERLAAKRQLLSFRIQLYRALGGSWTDELDRGMRLSRATAP